MNKHFVIEYIDVVLFMKHKQTRKKMKKETKTRNKKKAKTKDKKEGRKKRKKRETEKEKVKRGRPKKAGEKERETLEKKPFFRGKTGFILVKKQRKERNQKKNKLTKKQVRRV